MVDNEQHLSDEFVATAEREATRLGAEARRLRTSHEAHLRRASEALAKALRLESDLRELDELLGRAPQLRVDLQNDQLRGRRLALVAADLLARERGVGTAIHYREWFKLVVASRRRIPGKNPLASFLTEIARSPMVERLPDRQGVYRLNPDAAEARAALRLRTAETRLRIAEAACTDVPGAAGSRAERAAARREHSLAQRQLADIMTDGTQLRQAVASASAAASESG